MSEDIKKMEEENVDLAGICGGGVEREDREVLNTGAVSGSVTLTTSGAGTGYSWTSPTITIPPTK
jgi:hypothetical protein